MTSSSSSPDRGLLPSTEGHGVSPRPADQGASAASARSSRAPTCGWRAGARSGGPHCGGGGPPRRGPDLATGAADGRASGTAGEQLLEIREHVVGLLASAPYELVGELLGVGGGHAATVHCLIDGVLDAIAREHHQ